MVPSEHHFRLYLWNHEIRGPEASEVSLRASGGPVGGDPGPVEHLVGVDVAEPGQEPLVEQQRLDRHGPAGQAGRQFPAGRQGLERIGTEPAHRAVRQFRQQLGVTFPVAMDQQLVAGRAYKVNAIPHKVLIGVLMVFFALIEIVPRWKDWQFDRQPVLGGLASGFFGGLSGHQGAPCPLARTSTWMLPV